MTLLLLVGILAIGSGRLAAAKGDSKGQSPPRVLKAANPKYPSEALQKGLEGVVLIELVIDEEGKINDPRVVESIPELDEAALQTVKLWKFAPARTDGKAVRSTVRVPISFRIFKEGGQPRRKKLRNE